MRSDPLHAQVARARRRLWFNRWLNLLGWSMAIAAGAFVVLVLVERVTVLGIPLEVIALVLTVAAALGSVVWLSITRDSATAAAAALDEAIGLRERVTTSLYCTDSSDPFARATHADAIGKVSGITVSKHLPVRYPHSVNWAAASVVGALLVLWLMPPLDLFGRAQSEEEKRQKRQALETTQAAVKQAVARVQKASKQSEVLREAEDLEQLLDANEPMSAQQLRREAIKKLEDMSERLKQQQASAQYEQVEEVKKMLRRLGQPQSQDSLTDKLRKGLASGDFKGAQEALREMQEQLAKMEAGENPAKVKDMKAQLEKLAAQLDKLASNKKLADDLKDAGLNEDQVKRTLENLSKRDLDSVKEDLTKQGLTQEQIQKLMDKILKNQAACEACKGLAQKLGGAAQNMDSAGDMQSGQAASNLSKAAEQLSAMEMMQQEMMDMEAAMAELADAKSGLCDGEGAGQAEGDGMGTGLGQGALSGGGMGNPGRGQGGQAPLQKTSVRWKRERVRGKQSKGSIIGETFVEGRQLKGQARRKAVEVITSAEREATDALDRDRLPRAYHDSVKKYFGGLKKELNQPEAEKP